MSVFNDDKRTDLIGEAWIDLRDIIGPAGGDSDEWHQLNYKGKYAGEVRIEITFYDIRPKPERPVAIAKAKPMLITDLDPAAPPPAVTTTTGPRSMPKRRPLPSDPVTGKAPPQPQLPQPTPEAIEAPPSRQQPSPLPTSYQPTHSPQPIPEYHSPSPGAAGARYQEPLDPYAAHSPNGDYGAPGRYVEAPPQQYRPSDRPDQYMGHGENFDRYGSRSQDSFDRPQFEQAPTHRARSFDEDRPPPPPVHRSGTGSNPSMNASYQSGGSAVMRQDVLRNEALRQSSNTAAYPGRPQYKASPASGGSQYSGQEGGRHFSYDANFDPSYRAPMQATVEDVPESPDSIHGSYNRRRSFAPQAQPQTQLEPEYDMRTSPAPLNIGRGAPAGSRYAHDAAPEQRYSGGPAVPERYSNGPAVPDQHYGGGPAAPPQHYRHDSNGYPPSPPGQSPRDVSGQRPYGRNSETSLVSYPSQSDERALVRRSEPDGGHDDYPPPVPASLIPGIGPKVAQQVTERAHQRRNTQSSVMDKHTAPRGRTMSEIPPMYEQARSPSYNAPPSSYNAPSPAYNAPSPSYNAPSPSYSSQPPPSQSRGQIMYNEGPSSSSVNVVTQYQGYAQNPPRDPSPNPRTSPNPQHTIRRKSVSPAPARTDEPRRLSGIPFGPDSYDSFNPRLSTSALRDPASGGLDFNEATKKYIAPDGREVDPSDHLPVESWAPEPEPRKSNVPAPSPGHDLSGSARRRSMVPSTSSVTFSGSPYADPVSPSPPVTKGRTRLQKKQNRTSVAAPPVSGHAYSRSGGAGDMSPLAPLPPHQDNFTPPRHLTRASTFDSAGPSENSPHYGGGYSPSPHGGGGGGRPLLPPIPAKVPMEMSGALQLHSSSVAGRGNLDDYNGTNGHGYGYEQQQGGEWGGGGGGGTLEDEMARIDIGTGRSRRRRW